MTLVIDNIGLLVTNSDEHGDGVLGLRRDIALVLDGDTVSAIEPCGAAGDERIDADGRCVIPGFVDSHTHLVFAGDRGDEFVARMAGAPYQAGGILTTVAATRAASSDELRRGLAARRAEARRNGVTSIEIKSGYGLTTADERRALEIAGGETADTTLLAAHVVPPE
jgi:imidazolonepropionase